MKITKECRNKSEHLGQTIGYAARTINRLLDARVAARVTPELSGARGMILSNIVCADNEGRIVCQRDVEGWFHIRRSSVTAMLQGLEQDGFITRVSVENDARLKRMLPTEKGVVYQQRIKKCIDEFEAELRQGMAPQQQEVLQTLLNQLIENIQTMPEK